MSWYKVVVSGVTVAGLDGREAVLVGSHFALGAVYVSSTLVLESESVAVAGPPCTVEVLAE